MCCEVPLALYLDLVEGLLENLKLNFHLTQREFFISLVYVFYFCLTLSVVYVIVVFVFISVVWFQRLLNRTQKVPVPPTVIVFVNKNVHICTPCWCCV